METILAPHIEQTHARMKEHEVVLAVGDTMSINLSHFKEMEGIGAIGTKSQNQKGLLLHNTIALSGKSGVHLGILHEHWIVRSGAVEGTEKEKKERAIEEKESYKWVLGLRSTPKLEETRVISVSDAESDIYELISEADTSGKELLVRAAQDRLLVDPEGERVWGAVEKKPVCAEMTIKIGKRKTEVARKARVTVRHCRMKLTPPKRLRRNGDLKVAYPPVTVTAVLVREEDPPDGYQGVEWLLLTTISATKISDIIQLIQWYCMRWHIEIWHKVLKSGCQIEHRRFKTLDRFLVCLSMYLIIAYRLHKLTYLARAHPEQSCDMALSISEWQALYLFSTRRKTLPATPPSLAQATLWIAQLGGFLARKGDGQPGVTVMWRGWQRLQDIEEMYLALS